MSARSSLTSRYWKHIPAAGARELVSTEKGKQSPQVEGPGMQSASSEAKRLQQLPPGLPWAGLPPVSLPAVCASSPSCARV